SEFGASGTVDERGDGAAERVRGDASNLSAFESGPQPTADVVSCQERVVSSEEQQMLRVLVGDHDQAGAEYLGGEAGHGDSPARLRRLGVILTAGRFP